MDLYKDGDDSKGWSRSLAPLEKEAGLVRGLVKRASFISCVLLECSEGEQAREGPGFLEQPASFVLQLLTGELAPEHCLLWPDALHGNGSRTLLGEWQGVGQRDPVHL